MTESLDYQSAPVEPKPIPGVYYAERDCLGMFRRLFIDIVDGSLILLVSVAIIAAARRIDPWGPFGDYRATLACTTLTIVWFAYFVLLKRSRWGTIGYLLMGARIVDLHGGRPCLVMLTLRLTFATFGPFNVLADLIWIGGDPQRQALRDKFAGTYVIRKTARPAGQGEIGYSYFTVLGANFIFREVVRPPMPGEDDLLPRE